MNAQMRGRVLIVDDDLGISDGLTKLLTKYLLYVRCAASVREALCEIVFDRFDVIVLDWILPDGDGRQVLEFIRVVAPETIVIVYSAYPSSDAECTAASAHSFVTKSHDTFPIRNAVERGVRVARDQILNEQLERRTAMDEQDWFIETLRDFLQPINPDAAHLAVVGPGERLSRDLAWSIVSTPNRAAVAKEIDASRPEYANDIDDLNQHLFGSCSVRANYAPALHRGILDTPLPEVLLVRNADRLPRNIQIRLAECATRKSFRREGSDRDLDVDLRLIVTVRSRWSNKSPLACLDDSLRDVLESNAVFVPSLPSIPGGIANFLQRLVAKTCDKKVAISPAVGLLLQAIEIDNPWSSLRFALEERRDGSEDDVLEIEELGLPFFESSLVCHDGGAPRLREWKEVANVSKAVYVCRALSAVKGNVAEASRMTGLARTAIYSVLKEFNINQESFRPCRQRGLFRDDTNDEEPEVLEKV